MVELTTEDKALLDQITKRLKSVEDTLHKRHTERWDHFGSLYHNFQGLKDAAARGTAKDRYPLLQDARREFGHELFIPLTFSTVETVMARLVAHRPRMLVLPQNGRSERNVENMRGTIDYQQDRIDYETILHDVGKSGLMYGLGVQKTGWRRRIQKGSRVVPSSWVLQKLGKPWKLETYDETLVDDPIAEQVDIYDWFWDGYASEIDNAGWVLHRPWRNRGYVLDKFASGDWQMPEGVDVAKALDEEGGSAQRYAKAWEGRLAARGMPKPSERDSDIHEVWEYHDRSHVVTVLDGKWPVAIGSNDVWCGRLPFQTYRPTKVLNSMVGKGEIEPVEDLQLEINMLRTDRRWNALLKLHTPIFYNDGVIDNPHDIKWGPGEMNPVNGDPRDVIYMPNVGDIPNSSYQEEASLLGDWERTSGISDSSAGADSGAAQTATGIQLVHAAGAVRIQLKARRLEVEIIKQGARHWIKLNQRHILAEREMRMPALPGPDEPERRWTWLKVGPAELAGEFDVEPEGGSTTPENIPQKRQDAQMKLQLLGQRQDVDQRRLLVSAMEDLGFKHPETMLAPEARVPPKALDYIVQALEAEGADPQALRAVIGGAVHQAMDEEQQAAQDPQFAQAAGNGQNGSQEAA